MTGEWTSKAPDQDGIYWLAVPNFKEPLMIRIKDGWTSYMERDDYHENEKQTPDVLFWSEPISVPSLPPGHRMDGKD